MLRVRSDTPPSPQLTVHVDHTAHSPTTQSTGQTWTNARVGRPKEGYARCRVAGLGFLRVLMVLRYHRHGCSRPECTNNNPCKKTPKTRAISAVTAGPESRHRKGLPRTVKVPSHRRGRTRRASHSSELRPAQLSCASCSRSRTWLQESTMQTKNRLAPELLRV